TALITQRFLDADKLDAALRQTSADAIRAVARGVGEPVVRQDLLKRLATLLATSPVVCVYGPAGIGKSVLVSQLAQRNDWPIAFADALSPKDLFGTLANKLRGLTPEAALQFSTLEGARLALASAWADQKKCIIIVDSSPHIAELKSVITEAGGFTSTKRM